MAGGLADRLEAELEELEAELEALEFEEGMEEEDIEELLGIDLNEYLEIPQLGFTFSFGFIYEF